MLWRPSVPDGGGPVLRRLECPRWWRPGATESECPRRWRPGAPEAECPRHWRPGACPAQPGLRGAWASCSPFGPPRRPRMDGQLRSVLLCPWCQTTGIAVTKHLLTGTNCLVAREKEGKAALQPHSAFPHLSRSGTGDPPCSGEALSLLGNHPEHILQRASPPGPHTCHPGSPRPQPPSHTPGQLRHLQAPKQQPARDPQ